MKVSDKGGSDFKTVESGTYLARCYRLIDLGTQEGEYQGKPVFKREIVIGWEFPTELMEDGKPYVTSAFFTASLGEKANLRKFLTSWRGRDFTPEELEGFDMKKLLGATCVLNMITNKKGKVVVGSATPLMKGTQVPDQVNESMYFSLDADEFNAETLEGLADFFKTKIKSSPEYSELVNGTPTIQRNNEHQVVIADDDTIPF